MGEKLPVLSGCEVIKALSKAGFKQVAQRGSHIKLKKFDEQGNTLVICTIPNYKELPKYVIGCIIKQSKLTKEEFVRLLEK